MHAARTASAGGEAGRDPIGPRKQLPWRPRGTCSAGSVLRGWPGVLVPALLAASHALGCADRPQEPAEARPTATSTPTIASSAAPQPEPQPGSDLTWTVPAGWATEKVAERGLYRAKYTAAPIGNDKERAETLVRYLGRESQVDIPAELRKWMGEFDGDVGATAKREQARVGDIQVEIVEAAGTYKVGMGPPMGPKGKYAAYVVKEGWRSVAAMAVAPGKGVWFFRLVGPDETVQSARSELLGMLRSLK